MTQYKLSEKEAEVLINGFSQRTGGIIFKDFDKSKLVKSLTSFSYPTSDFMISFPKSSDYEATIENTGQLYIFSIRRSLTNNKIPLSKKPSIKRLGTYVKEIFGNFSSNAIIDKLMQENELRMAMKNSPSQISLFGKLRNIDDEKFTITLSPILSVPGADSNMLCEIEQKYKKFYNTSRHLGLIPKRPERRAEGLYDNF